MDQAGKINAFRPSFAAGLLTLAAGLLALIAWQVVPPVCGRPPRAGAAIAWSALLIWSASLLGLVPLALVASQGVMPTVRAYFIGAGVRLFVSLVGCLVLVFAFHLATRPVLLTAGSMYATLLMVEVALIGRYLWHLTGATPPTHGAGPVAECPKS
jgi:hypothetical protein